MALLEERAEKCPMCGHPMSECRDRRTAGSWEVITDTCQPSLVAEAYVDNQQHAKARKRGQVILTRRTGGPHAA